MNDCAFEGRLNEYVDGALSTANRMEMEAHLEGCASCRVGLERLRALMRLVDRAPRSIQPPRDLWPEIAACLGKPGRTNVRPSWPLLAAAALLLVVATAAVTAVVVWDGGGESGHPAIGSELVVAEAEYTKAITELEEALRVARERLAAETVVLIERNLRIVDEAIAEAKAALLADPASVVLREALSQRYTDKLAVLRHVSRLAIRS